jgi:hypothetical protein
MSVVDPCVCVCVKKRGVMSAGSNLFLLIVCHVGYVCT